MTEAISVDLDRQEVSLKELHIDRAYLSSHARSPAQRRLGGLLQSLASSRRQMLSQAGVCFGLGTANHPLSGFAGNALCARWGGPLSESETCAQCPLKTQCTTSSKGRSVSIHPDEALLIELRQRQQTPRGGPNCANGWPSSIPLHMWDAGKDDAHAIVGYARISSICAAAPWSTICTSWLVPSRFRLSFNPLLDYLTDALGSRVISAELY